jgi:hypothetical protein
MSAPMSPEQEFERTARTLRRGVRLLLVLFDVRQELLISEAALKIIVNEFARRLEREILNGGGDELLDRWEKRLPVIRTELVRMTMQSPVMFADGKHAVVFSHEKAARLLGLCPDTHED